MNISLIDVDGHNFPNLALMKISAYHKKQGDKVKWFDPLFDKPDKIYASKVFTFTNDYNYLPLDIIQGGTGYNLKTVLQKKFEHICPDYSLYNYPHALGFLTRGCIRKCDYCIVPEKEGKIKANADITEFLDNRKTAILLDNNILASKWGLEQIEKIIKLKIKVDFNQGIDARLVTKDIAKLLSRVKWLRPLRMACDYDSQIDSVLKATKLLREYNCTPKNYFIYLLVKDIPNAWYRAIILKANKLDPFAQSFIDFKNNIMPTKIMRHFARWVNHKAIFKSVEWVDYKRGI